MQSETPVTPVNASFQPAVIQSAEAVVKQR